MSGETTGCVFCDEQVVHRPAICACCARGHREDEHPVHYLDDDDEALCGRAVDGDRVTLWSGNDVTCSRCAAEMSAVSS